MADTAKTKVLSSDSEATATRQKYGEQGWMWTVSYRDWNGKWTTSKYARQAKMAWQHAAEELGL